MNLLAEHKIKLSQAYKRTFNGEATFMIKLLTPLFRKLAYKKVFDLDAVYAGIVLNDLRTFCRGTGSKWGNTDRDTLRLVARNEVYEHIRAYINISEADINKQYEITLENFDD